MAAQRGVGSWLPLWGVRLKDVVTPVETQPGQSLGERDRAWAAAGTEGVGRPRNAQEEGTRVAFADAGGAAQAAADPGWVRAGAWWPPSSCGDAEAPWGWAQVWSVQARRGGFEQ